MTVIVDEDNILTKGSFCTANDFTASLSTGEIFKATLEAFNVIKRIFAICLQKLARKSKGCRSVSDIVVAGNVYLNFS